MYLKGKFAAHVLPAVALPPSPTRQRTAHRAEANLAQLAPEEEFIQKQKELIEYLEDHISKITDIISGI